MTAPIVQAQGLSKVYKSGGKRVTAVTDVSFAVQPGEIFGLFGPNGAGKSTLIRMLATLLLPTSGRATVNQFDLVRQPLQVRASVGLVTADERAFYGRLSARQNLQFFAAMQNVPRMQIRERVAAVLALFGLAHKGDADVQALSTGQKQRLNMARALIHDPPLLFLDEPTKSMDVQTSDFVKELVRKKLVDQQQKTVIFISHELYEMDNFCDRVAILAGGRVRALGSPAELSRQLPRRALFRLTVAADVARLLPLWQALPQVESVLLLSEGAAVSTVDIALKDDQSAWQAVLDVLGRENGRLESYQRVDDESLRRIVAHFSQTNKST